VPTYIKIAEAYIVKDGTHDSPKYIDGKLGYPLVTSKNLRTGRLDLANVDFISKEDFDKINLRSKVDKGDLLLVMIGTIGNPVVIETEPYFAIKNVALFKKNQDGNSLEYLKFILCSDQIKKKLSADSTGGTQKFVSLGYLRNLQIPLPPLPEQIHIANVLSKAEKLIAKRKESLALLDAYLKSTFLEMFGDPVRNEKGWEVKRLGAGARIKHGFAFLGEFFSESGDYVLLTPGNFYEEGGFRSRGDKQKFYTGDIPEDYILKRGNLLVAMTEQAAGLLGSPLIVPENDRYLHNQRLGLVNYDVTKFNLYYLFFYFNQTQIRSLIHLRATGTKVRHTSPTKLEELFIPNPPLELQNQFAAVVEKVEALKERYQESLRELEALYGSLSQRAFRGELGG